MIKKQHLVFTALTTSALIFSGCDKSKNTNNSEELKKTKEQLATTDKSLKTSESKVSELNREISGLKQKIQALEKELEVAKKTDPEDAKIAELQEEILKLKAEISGKQSEKLEKLSAMSETYFGVTVKRAYNKNNGHILLKFNIDQYQGNELYTSSTVYDQKTGLDLEKMIENIVVKAKITSADTRELKPAPDGYVYVCQDAVTQGDDGYCKSYLSPTINSPMTFELTGAKSTSLFSYLNNKPVSVSRIGLVDSPTGTNEKTKIDAIDLTKELTFYFYQTNPKKLKPATCTITMRAVASGSGFFGSVKLKENATVTYANNILELKMTPEQIKDNICTYSNWTKWNKHKVELDITCSESLTFYRRDDSDLQLYTIEVYHDLTYPIDRLFSASDFASFNCPKKLIPKLAPTA